MIIYPLGHVNQEAGKNAETSRTGDINSQANELTSQGVYGWEADFDSERSTNNSELSTNSPEADSSPQDNNPMTPNGIFRVFPELSGLSPNVFDYESIFTSGKSGSLLTGTNKLKLRLVKAVHDVLVGNILHDDEQILNIARGIAYYKNEIPYANGILTNYSNYFAIVCTSYRLIFINVNFSITAPSRYIFQVLYEEIRKISTGLFGSSLVIQTRTDRNWNFTTVHRKTGKEIQALVLAKTSGGPSGKFDGVSRWQLCPACFFAIPGKLASCPSCAAMFKTPAEAMTRALILPGLGSFYLSYIPLGFIELFGYLAIWAIAVILVVIGIPGGILSAVILVMLCHLFAGNMSRIMASKGYIVDRMPAADIIETSSESVPSQEHDDTEFPNYD